MTSVLSLNFTQIYHPVLPGHFSEALSQSGTFVSSDVCTEVNYINHSWSGVTPMLMLWSDLIHFSVLSKNVYCLLCKPNIAQFIVSERVGSLYPLNGYNEKTVVDSFMHDTYKSRLYCIMNTRFFTHYDIKMLLNTEQSPDYNTFYYTRQNWIQEIKTTVHPLQAFYNHCLLNGSVYQLSYIPCITAKSFINVISVSLFSGITKWIPSVKS